MDKDGFLRKLRLFLADPEQKIWEDSELYTILDDSLIQYSKDSGAYTGSFEFFPDKNGIYHYPEDYCSFMIGWNSKSQEIAPITAAELFGRSLFDYSRPGDVKYIYDDTRSYGDFSLYPESPDKQNIRDITITPEFGEIQDSQYGVFIDSEYGTTLSVSIFDFAGTIFYRKLGRFEDVKDYMAVICYALFLAYSADSEFGNSDMAAYWKGQYRARLAVFSRVLHDNTGRKKTANFY